MCGRFPGLLQFSLMAADTGAMGAIAASSPVSHVHVLPLRTLSDERLAELAGVGHSDAFATLYERYRDSLARYCRSIVRDAEDAGDALQNTMVAVLKALQVRRPSGPVRPWMYRIAHNESISILRRRHPHEELSSETPARSDTELASFARYQLQALFADLRALPENQRGALVMRELGGLQYDEIGQALEMSAVSARKHVFEARVALNDIAAGRDTDCAEIMRRISDGDRRVLRARSIRGHLRECTSCAAFERGMRARGSTFALIPGIPAVTAAPLLIAVLHGAGMGGSGLAASGSVAGGTVAGGTVASGTVASGTVAGGAIAGGSVASGVMAAGSLLGGGSFAALKGLVAAGALAVAGAGVLVGTGVSTSPPAPHHAAAVTHAARKVRTRRHSAPGPQAIKPRHLHLLPPPPPPAVPHAHLVAAVVKVPSTATPVGATTQPSTSATSSRPNTQAPVSAVPVTATTPTSTSNPAPTATTTPTTPAPATGNGTGAGTGTGSTAGTVTPATASTSWIDQIIQGALQSAGADVAAAEQQATQALSLAGDIPGTQAATSLVQSIINGFLSAGH